MGGVAAEPGQGYHAGEQASTRIFMKSPFPGMDPYLEAREGWRGVHLHLICEICRSLQPQLLPQYVAVLEERVVLGSLEDDISPDVRARERAAEQRAGRAGGGVSAVAEVTLPEYVDVPELEIPHRWVEVRDARTREVVTVIEVLSPSNKVGKGREDYRKKQEELLLSDANLVEIDLLRRGRHTVAVPERRVAPSDYRVCVHRAGRRRFEVVRWGVRDPLPNIGIPLRPEEPDVVLHLGDVFRRCYEEGAYAYIAEYAETPDPPFAPEDAAWADTRLQEWRAEVMPARGGLDDGDQASDHRPGSSSG